MPKSNAARAPQAEPVLARPEPKAKPLGRHQEEEHPAIAKLKQAGRASSIATSLPAAETPAQKPAKAKSTFLSCRVTKNTKSFIRIAAAMKGLNLEEYMMYAVNLAFKEDGIKDQEGALVQIKVGKD